MSGLFDQSMKLVQRYGLVYINATISEVQPLADGLFTQVDIRVDRVIDAKNTGEIPIFNVK